MIPVMKRSWKLVVALLNFEFSSFDFLCNNYGFASQMLKGRATTFRITADPDLKTHGTFRMQSVDTSVFILEWLVNNTDRHFSQ